MSLVSSANLEIVVAPSMSLMYKMNSIGPETEPCGTPDLTSAHSEHFPFNTTLCILLDSQSCIHPNTLPVMPAAS